VLFYVPSGQYNKAMAQRSDGQATRQRLLLAAAHLVASEGPSALTLERAAEVAGVSKGAVLYHFKAKSALIAALVGSALDRFDAATEAVVLRKARSPGSYASAYAKVAFNPQSNTPEASAGLLAALTNDIDLLVPAVERHAAVQKRLEADGISPACATLIRLAADGLYLTRALGLAPPTNAQAAKVLTLILNLIEDPVSKRKKR
jgi:AcrR family transcriptional regulator